MGDSPEERERAAERLMVTVPVLDPLIPLIVDSMDDPSFAGDVRQRLLETLKSKGHITCCEGKIRGAAIRSLNADKIEALARHFASQPRELRSALLEWAFALNWARVEILDWVQRVRESLERPN